MLDSEFSHYDTNVITIASLSTCVSLRARLLDTFTMLLTNF